MHIAERAPDTQFVDEPVIREELSKIDTAATALAERQADAATLAALLRRMAREFDALRVAHEKLTEDVATFGKVLGLIEETESDGS